MAAFTVWRYQYGIMEWRSTMMRFSDFALSRWWRAMMSPFCTIPCETMPLMRHFLIRYFVLCWHTERCRPGSASHRQSMPIGKRMHREQPISCLLTIRLTTIHLNDFFNIRLWCRGDRSPWMRFKRAWRLIITYDAWLECRLRQCLKWSPILRHWRFFAYHLFSPIFRPPLKSDA